MSLFARARVATLTGGTIDDTQGAEEAWRCGCASAKHETVVLVGADAEGVMAEAEGLYTRCADRHCGMHEEDFLPSDIYHTDGRVFVTMLSAPIVFGIPCDGDSGTRGSDGHVWKVSGWGVAQ